MLLIILYEKMDYRIPKDTDSGLLLHCFVARQNIVEQRLLDSPATSFLPALAYACISKYDWLVAGDPLHVLAQITLNF